MNEKQVEKEILNDIKVDSFIKSQKISKTYENNELESNAQSDNHTTEKNDSKYECKSCHKKFKFKSKLLRHSQSHTDIRPFQCPHCPSAFFDSHLLKRHILVHTKKFPFRCKQCKKHFYCESDYKKHLLTHEINMIIVQRHKCKICYKSYQQIASLRRHQKLAHSGRTPYCCNICNKAFSTFTTLIEHRDIHKDFKPYICEICDKAISTSVRLREHYSLHTGLKLYRCGVCNNAFGYRSSLKKHLQSIDACNKKISKDAQMSALSVT